MTLSRWLWAAAVAVVAPAALPAADPAEDLAGRIDHWLGAGWAKAKIEPAPPADDATFLRRAYLDIVGRIPTVTEAREFLDDPAPDKRRRLLEKLLADPASVEHFTHVLRSWFMPDPDVSPLAAQFTPQFEGWLRLRLTENAGYDRMVREMLTAAPAQQGGRRQLGGIEGGGGGGGGAAGFALA